jgi:hypothetical protein
MPLTRVVTTDKCSANGVQVGNFRHLPSSDVEHDMSPEDVALLQDVAAGQLAGMFRSIGNKTYGVVEPAPAPEPRHARSTKSE